MGMPGSQPKLFERCVVALPTRTAKQLSESKADDPAAHGLDPEIYFAVVTGCELGSGGLVNENERIYPVPRFIESNLELNARIGAGEFNACEKGHPIGGAATLNIAARLVTLSLHGPDGVQLESESGEVPLSVTAKGDIAFLRTTEGQDLYTLYRAGFPLGVSAVNMGIPSPHTIGEDSPHLEANPAHAGATVDIIEKQIAERYDIVHSPSAGTFIPVAEARTAYESLCESALLPPLASETEQEQTMLTLESLRKDHPELVATLTEAATKSATEAALASNPLMARIIALGEGGESRVAKLLEALGTDTGSEATLAEQVAEQLKGQFEAQFEAQRTESAAIKAMLEASKKENADLKEASVKREKADANRIAFSAAMEQVHSNLRPLIEGKMGANVAAMSSPEAVTTAVEQLAEFAKLVSEATAAPVTPETPEGDQGTDESEPAQTNESPEAVDDPLFEAILGSAPGASLREDLGR